MSFTFADGQILCPYNSSHVVSKQRAIPHLAKCRQQHPQLAEKVQICPYNQGHHVHKEQMTDHLKGCDERSAFQPRSGATNHFTARPTVINRTSDSSSQSRAQVEDDDINEWL